MPWRHGYQPRDPFADPLDAVLAEIAVNIQLPPGLHAKAIDRYEAVRRYIERPGSPLEGRVACFYSQGSMAIDATTSTRGTDDEYDLDIVAEIDGPDLGPEALLDDLEAALEGYPVSRIVRQTRCITLYYADGMHLDVTPSRRRATKEKEGDIPHAKKGASGNPPPYVPMNSYAFAKWYCARTPTEERFALALNQRLYEQAGIAFAAADVEEVLPQTPLIIKSVTTVALQLIKRHRNIAYAKETGRIPPSVMLSCHAGHAAHPSLGLADMVIRQARWTARAIDVAAKQGRLLSVPNPEFPAERFTDRWPESQVQQTSYSTSESGVKFRRGNMVIRARAVCSRRPRRRSSARRRALPQSPPVHIPTWASGANGGDDHRRPDRGHGLNMARLPANGPRRWHRILAGARSAPASVVRGRHNLSRASHNRAAQYTCPSAARTDPVATT
jgi:hypothetical protein